MLRIDRHHDSQLAAHLSSLDYDSYVSDTADEIIADSILETSCTASACKLRTRYAESF